MGLSTARLTLLLAMVGALLCVAPGCARSILLPLATTCELSSECRAPLVCRLEACREECRESRDCRPGTRCVRDAEGFGVCQLDSESECALTSDCPTGLECHFGECTNACLDDRDCINGSVCERDPAMEMLLACVDVTTTECRRNSDCPAPLICTRDLRCREQCRENRDCRDGRICAQESSPRTCIDFVPLPRPPPLATFASSGQTSCVTRASTLTCFGRNSSGQVGNGGLDSPAAPFDVLVGTPITAVGVGNQHACAITDALYCWGISREGQLGQMVPGDVATSPLPVPMAAGLVGLALGYQHTCAWSATEAFCWGRNDVGQLGDGTIGGMRASVGPAIDLGGPAVHLGCGEIHSCAVRSDGALFCWGRNDNGELGDGTMTTSATPVRALVDDVVEVAGGRRHTCALRADRTIRCWGENVDGQIGNGATGLIVLAPTEPLGLLPVVQLTVGQRHTCVLEVGGTVKCFGYAGDGRLGVDVAGVDPMLATPTTVPLPEPAAELRAGEDFTCARTASGNRYCFGSNAEGQFGDLGPGGATPRLIAP